MQILSLPWDYITTLNCLFANELIPHFYTRLDRLGAWSGDINHFIKVAKNLNDRIKLYGLDDEPNPWFYVELATLTGYRNPPFPGFDIAKESESLANAGNEFFLPLSSFRDMAKENLLKQPHPVTFLTFEEWLASAKWNTSGASSYGRVTVDTPDGPQEFKARKNQLLDLESAQNLAKMALSTNDQEH